MTKKKIIEFNKMLNAYMGQNVGYRINPKTLKWEINAPKYDSSWDLLKPVIDKVIKSINGKCIDECTSYEWHNYKKITEMYIGISIEQAYQLVVDYILWERKKKDINLIHSF